MEYSHLFSVRFRRNADYKSMERRNCLIVVVLGFAGRTRLDDFNLLFVTFQSSRICVVCLAKQTKSQFVRYSDFKKDCFFVNVTGDGRSKPETYFLPERFRWTLLPNQRYGVSCSAVGRTPDHQTIAVPYHCITLIFLYVSTCNMSSVQFSTLTDYSK